MKLGTLIKERRKAAGLTQKQLAQKIGKAEITVRQYEKGGIKPSLETKIAIANALNFAYSDYESAAIEESIVPDIEIDHGSIKPSDEEDANAIIDEELNDPGYMAVLDKNSAEEAYYAENGYYDVYTHEKGGKIVNEIVYFPPTNLLDGMTEEEVKLIRDYRDFLIWKRKQKQPGNNGS